jgi:hypothetical protein
MWLVAATEIGEKDAEYSSQSLTKFSVVASRIRLSWSIVPRGTTLVLKT